MKKNSVTKKLVLCAFMGALSYVLMMLHLPFKYLGFLELEFSDIPAILCTFVYGPIPGVAVEVIKNLLKVITASTTGGVGELANLVVSAGYIIPLGIVWKVISKNKESIAKLSVAALAGTIGFVITGILINYFVTVPLYCNLFGGAEAVIGACAATVPAIDSIAKVVIIGITPFNIVKGIIISIIGICLYKPFKRIVNVI